MEKKLLRSKENKVLAGVCGGIAEYFAIDPTLVRIGWVAFALAGGSGIIAYIIAAIIIPEKSGYKPDPDSWNNVGNNSGFNDNTDQAKSNMNLNLGRGSYIAGAIFIFLGIVLFAQQFFKWINLHLFWPGILIIIGIAVIYGGRRR